MGTHRQQSRPPSETRRRGGSPGLRREKKKKRLLHHRGTKLGRTNPSSAGAVNGMLASSERRVRTCGPYRKPFRERQHLLRLHLPPPEAPFTGEHPDSNKRGTETFPSVLRVNANRLLRVPAVTNTRGSAGAAMPVVRTVCGQQGFVSPESAPGCRCKSGRRWRGPDRRSVCPAAEAAHGVTVSACVALTASS